MSRSRVEEVLCDRCKTKELRPIVDSLVVKSKPDFFAELTTDVDGKPLVMSLVYPDLCSRCKKALQNYWEMFTQWKRDGDKLIGTPLQPIQPSLSPAEPVTPVRPHSPMHAPTVPKTEKKTG